MPRTVGVMPSGSTLRVKKTFLNKMLTEDTAKNIGLSSYYPYVRKVFDDILRALDTSFGRPFLMTNTTSASKEAPDDAKPKLDLFRTVIAGELFFYGPFINIVDRISGFPPSAPLTSYSFILIFNLIFFLKIWVMLELLIPIYFGGFPSKNWISSNPSSSTGNNDNISPYNSILPFNEYFYLLYNKL